MEREILFVSCDTHRPVDSSHVIFVDFSIASFNTFLTSVYRKKKISSLQSA